MKNEFILSCLLSQALTYPLLPLSTQKLIFHWLPYIRDESIPQVLHPVLSSQNSWLGAACCSSGAKQVAAKSQGWLLPPTVSTGTDYRLLLTDACHSKLLTFLMRHKEEH